MSTYLANIFLALAALLFFVLFLPFFHSKIATSNDQGASGYVIIIIIFLHLLILGLLSTAYIIIGRQGYFDWVAGHSGVRILVVSIGLLSCVIISSIGFMSRIAPGNNPDWLQWVASYAPALILIILVGTGFILNNHFLRESIPLPLYKWPFLLLSAGCLVGIGMIGVSAALSSSPSALEATRQYESAESIKNSRLAQIDSADMSSDLVRILEFTGNVYPPEVRQKAAAKILTDTSWQNDLIQLLENDHALEVFNFLQSNDVRDKKLFLQPVLTGVMAVAARIRHDIQGTSSSAFSADMFTDEVQRTLLTVEKFEGMGVDYLPAVKEMRAALDEPGANKKVKYDCIPVLEEWIKKRG